MKKLVNLLLCSVMTVTMITQHVIAKEEGGKVIVSQENDEISIGNQFIKRTFLTKSNRWKTKNIENKRINEVFEPSEGSEDFIINLVNPQEDLKPSIVKPTKVLSTEKWTSKLSNEKGEVFQTTNKLFDSNPYTYVNEWQFTGHPFSLEINLGSIQTVSSFSYLKRPGFDDKAYGTNGTMGKYKLFVSKDGKTWSSAGIGEFSTNDYQLHSEVLDKETVTDDKTYPANTTLYNVGEVVYGNFGQTYETQYVKIECLSDVLGKKPEFTGAEINLYEDKVNKGLPIKELSLKDKKITLGGKDGTKLSDGNFHYALSAGLNDEIIIDLGTKQNIGSFAYQKRPGFHEKEYGRNGTMGKYELYVSDDGTKWNSAGKGEFQEKDYQLHSIVLEEALETSDKKYEKGTTLYNVGNLVYGNLDKVYQTRYLKIIPKSDCLGNQNEFHVSEIKLFEDQKWEQKKEESQIRSSELSVKEIKKGTNDIRVSFMPYEKNGVLWSIDMITVMEDNKHYMNSYLEISSNHPDQVAIDYIDFDRFIINENNTKDIWSIPDEDKISSMWIGKHELMLGQPIYADGLFFGSEFPAQDTDVKNHVMQIRYYSGKTIAQMAKDGQNVINGTTFRTWNNVVGSAKGTPMDVVQIDFFKYIEDIATPSNFRKQYNSWYDNMMNINDSSIEKSFLGSEKGLAKNGIEPLDSYVVDDGWNNYNNEIGNIHAPSESGSTLNQTGFWEFNDKFPNELYTSSHLANKLNSTFGVWVGPQGGYNFFGGFADYLESMGTGFAQTNSALGKVVCTGSKKYIHNFETRFIDYQTRFNIDYWKWDGFASRPCDNPNHDHMVGGDQNMYFTSDMWESWTNLFENVREARRKEGKGLWINATCYINLSPWLLQWVNTIWVQDSGDTGEAGDERAARHQRKIYYRDNVYHNLYKKNQIQFPLKNIYNHDPIYGVSDGSKATTNEFREFMLDNAMRGTAFWELYYSPSIFDDEKWQVTADVLDFAEKHHDVLKNAKLFVQDGQTPSTGVYGYSAWNQNQGFISFVNSTSQKQTYELQLNNIIGVPTNMKDWNQIRIYPYSGSVSKQTFCYNDKLQVTLEPFSSQIYEFGTNDQKAPQLVSAKIHHQNRVEVKFNERMSDQVSFKINGKKVKGILLDDYRTFELHVNDLGDHATLSLSNIKDIYGNQAENQVETILTADKIVDIKEKADIIATKNKNQSIFRLGEQQYEVSKTGVKGKTDFSVSMAIATLDSNVTLLQQGTDYRLSINKDGYVVFDVNGTSITSKEEIITVKEKAHGRYQTDSYVETTTNKAVIGKVNDGKLHAIQGVRELNGTIKLYIDGKLSSSFYQENNQAKLNGSSIVLGDVQYQGYVSDVSVSNSASYYDDAELFANKHQIGQTMKKLDSSKWKAKACSEESSEVKPGIDGAAASVVDQDSSTYWHSNYSGKDNCKDQVHELTIDFNEELAFDSLEYVARPNGRKSNGTWEKVNVIGIDENGNETILLKDQVIELTNNTYLFNFEQTQTFSQVRFEIQGINGFASAAEIQAYQKIKQNSYDVLTLQKKAKELYQQIKKEDYEEHSYQVFADKVNEILDMDLFSSKETIDRLSKELEQAKAQLKRKESITPLQPSKPNQDKGEIEVETPITGVTVDVTLLWFLLIGSGMLLSLRKLRKN